MPSVFREEKNTLNKFLKVTGMVQIHLEERMGQLKKKFNE